MIAWRNCAAAEMVDWQFWLPVMSDGLCSLSCSVSGGAGCWRVWRVKGAEEFYIDKASAFAAAEGWT